MKRFNSSARGPQRGAVLVISLIVLMVLMLAGVALVRSTDTALFQSSNLAFQRDMANQSERVMPVVQALLTTGVLSTPASRAANMPAANYSASVLNSNAQGIPLALVNNTLFTGTLGMTPANDITLTDPTTNVSWGSIRYIIDRQCTQAGDETTLGNLCAAATPASTGCTSDNLQTCALGVPSQIVYRVSVRVNGPRNTQAFFQTSVTR